MVSKHLHYFKTKIVNIAIATLLLIGLIILGYGYFQHIKTAFYVGLFITIAGVLNGINQIIKNK